MITLEDIYNNSNSVSDITDIPETVRERIKQIAKHCYSQKGVYTVTITLLLYKINHPQQDIRYHQSRWENGFSGRSFDTEYVTPVLAKLKLPAMAESGWLTRSLEQPYPYDLNYKGNISGGMKDVFLQTKLYEAVEIKFNKKIDPQIVSIVEKKVYKFNPKRYYILSYYGIKSNSSDEINDIVARVKRDHGCEIIVNGLLTTIKYYLRLISSSQDFVNIYTKAVEQDKELMKIHKDVWSDILQKALS